MTALGPRDRIRSGAQQPRFLHRDPTHRSEFNSASLRIDALSGLRIRFMS